VRLLNNVRRSRIPEEIISAIMGLRKEPPEVILKNLLDELASSGRIDSYFEGGSPDLLMEVIAGFIHERCDNMLANVKEKELRTKVLEIARTSYELYLKAYVRNNLKEELELPAFIVNEEEYGKYSEIVKRGLSSGKLELVLLPRGWSTLFFKQYYLPRRTDQNKLKRTIATLRGIISHLKRVKLLKERYGDHLERVHKAIDELHGVISLERFIE